MTYPLQSVHFPKRQCKEMTTNESSNLIHGPAIPKYEINGAFNITFLEVMPTSVVAKSILRTIKPTTGEVRFIPRYPKRRRLPSLHSRPWRWRRVLDRKPPLFSEGKKKKLSLESIINFMRLVVFSVLP